MYNLYKHLNYTFIFLFVYISYNCVSLHVASLNSVENAFIKTLNCLHACDG